VSAPRPGLATRPDPSTLLGANPLPNGGTMFRVWAPRASLVEVELYGANGAKHIPLEPRAGGYYVGAAERAGPGDRYRYRLDRGQAYPDPASRFQPEGVHGPSEIVDPRAFVWTDQGWEGLDRRQLSIYELHVGTFSPRGTFDGLIPELPELASLGLTAIELMPVAEFPGRWNWGYDGVDLFAPASVYGGPEALRRLVDAAHRVGLGVLLDVVYNHLGPDGNYLRQFSTDYFTDRHQTPWGEAVNYDGPNSGPVRAFVLENVSRWLDEFHLDGLRLDATHAIVDQSPRHLLAEIAEVAHRRPRPALVIAEDHRNLVRLIDRPPDGYGLDGVWADDFHHVLRTFLTGEFEGYFADYSGRLADLAATIEGGFLFQGQARQAKRVARGTPVTSQPSSAFVFCTENHDQVGNRALGERLAHLTDPARYALATALLLCSPETVLLFQGQEFAASTPFLYFTDHHLELGRLVTAGRRREFAHFSAFSDPARRERIPDPQVEATFARSRLDLGERAKQAEIYATYRRLLRLRRDDPVLSHPDRLATRATAVGQDALALHRWAGSEHRLLLVNFGPAEVRVPMAVAASGPPPGAAWRLLWESGQRSTALDGARWNLPSRSGCLLAGSRPD
jgi:maltooligosyltrehalose trehalohydrolase